MVLNTIELFSGTASFSKVADRLGHDTFTIDNNADLNPDFCINLLELPMSYFDKKYDVLWASPPCTAFSVASIGKHWINLVYLPKSDTAKLGLKILDRTIEIISSIKPKLWYIENPRGMMRNVINDIFKKHDITQYRRVTVTYCQYGDTRMKPTDIWTNDFSWIPKPACKNGDSCHVKSPRGSRTGTQGINGAKDRGVIPEALFIEIFKQKEN